MSKSELVLYATVLAVLLVVAGCHSNPCAAGETRVGDVCVVSEGSESCRDASCARCKPTCSVDQYCAAPNECHSFAVNWASSFEADLSDAQAPLATDRDSNLFVLGLFDNPSSAVKSFAADGTTRWTIPMTLSANASVSLNAIAIDGPRNLGYVSGTFRGDRVDFGGQALDATALGYLAGSTHLFLLQFDSATGKTLSIRGYNTQGGVPTNLGVDAMGHVCVAGPFGSQIEFPPKPALTFFINPHLPFRPVFVTCLDPADGSALWVFSFARDVWRSTQLAMAVSPDGAPIVAGTFSISLDVADGFRATTGSDGFALKIAPDGTLKWAQTYDGNADVSINAVAIDGDGVPYLGGSSAGSPWLAGLAVDSGIATWTRSYDVLSGDVRSMTSGPAHDLYVTGSFDGRLSLSADTTLLSNRRDLWAGRMSARDGSATWGMRFGGDEGDAATSVTVTAASQVVVLGSFGGVVDFGKGPLDSKNGKKVLLQVTQ